MTGGGEFGRFSRLQEELGQEGEEGHAGQSRVGLKSNVEGFGTADGLSNVHTAMHVTCRVAHTVSPESNAFKVLTRRSTTTSGTDLPDLSID